MSSIYISVVWGMKILNGGFIFWINARKEKAFKLRIHSVVKADNVAPLCSGDCSIKCIFRFPWPPQLFRMFSAFNIRYKGEIPFQHHQQHCPLYLSETSSTQLFPSRIKDDAYCLVNILVVVDKHVSQRPAVDLMLDSFWDRCIYSDLTLLHTLLARKLAYWSLHLVKYHSFAGSYR